MVIPEHSAVLGVLEILQGPNPYLFLSGKAGSGKTTLLQAVRKASPENSVLLAPTGTAADHAGGETIHSFFRFTPGVSPADVPYSKALETLLQTVDTLLIDEVSMVRADLLDCIDVSLRRHTRRDRPFGGKRIVLSGDGYQLSPVLTGSEREVFHAVYKTPHFFSSKVYAATPFQMMEMENVYRQSDPLFIGLLNAIRHGKIGEAELEFLNSRVCEAASALDERSVLLTPYSRVAEEVNLQELERIFEPEHHYLATVTGNYSERDLPAETVLTLKPGARVMFLNNDPDNRWQNGTMGRVEELFPHSVSVKTDGGVLAEVFPVEWTLYESFAEGSPPKLSRRKNGSFEQIPLRLGWAVTIHKSQGKSFDRVCVDFGKGTFAPGQAYVALSRCRSLEGLSLKRPLTLSDLKIDPVVVRFLTKESYRRSEEEMPIGEKQKLVERAIAEGKKLEMVYLKRDDTRSRRVVVPHETGKMTFGKQKFLGLKGFCETRSEERTFRLDRVLELRVVD